MNSIVIRSNNAFESTIMGCSHFFMEDINIPIGIVSQNEPDFKGETEHKDCVMIKKDAFSCNHRDKAFILSLLRRLNENKDRSIAYCCPIGSEFVGKVIKVGEKIEHLKIGDKVIPLAEYPFPFNREINPGLPTNYASKRFQIFHKDQVLKIPTQMPDELAASITIAGHTIFNMIEKAKISNGENVLITSLKSNTSLAILSALKNRGCNIYGLSTSSGFANNFLQLGAKKVFTQFEELKQYLGDVKRFNVVFDPFSDLHLGKITDYMDIDSKYLTCGFSNQYETLEKRNENYEGKNIPELLVDIVSKNISIIGNCLGEKRHLEQAIDEYLKGNFDIPIDSVITGSNIAYFFDRTFNDPDRFGKVVYKYED